RAAESLIGWRNIALDESAQTVQLLRQGMRLDLGAIGKGYAADCALEVVKQRGIACALIDVGGDLVCGDVPPGRKGWEIAVVCGDGSEPMLPLTEQCSNRDLRRC